MKYSIITRVVAKAFEDICGPQTNDAGVISGCFRFPSAIHDSLKILALIE